MANAFRGEADFKAGDKTFTLCLHVNALCEAEDALGMDIDVLLAKYAAGPSLRMLRGLVWAGLQERHPCSLEEAGDIVTEASFLVAKAALEKALMNAMPPEAAQEKNPRKRGRAGTGSSS